jgi:hypothetical protein
MNAESSSDNDIHGEGSQSQQQDLRMAQEVSVEEPEVNNEMEHYEEEPGDYDEEQQDEEDQEAEDDEEQYEMDEHEEQIILQQPAPMNVHLVDEEAEGEEMMGEYAMEDDNEDLDEDDLLSDEEMDDMPSDEEDQMMMPVGMGGHHHRGRHGRNERVLQRDILFDAGGAPPGHAAFVGARLRLEREHAVADLGRAPGGLARGSHDFGPNWSQEEEEVSQILRNLRGLAQNGAAAGPEPNPHAPGQVAPQPLNHRYRIELEVASQFKDRRQQLAQAKKSIEQIKQEQAKPSNNQVSSVFQIVKPLDLHGECLLAQAIDQEFWRSALTRESIMVEEDRAERKKQADSAATLAQLLQLGLFEEESDEDDPASAGARAFLSAEAAPFHPGGFSQVVPHRGLFREVLGEQLGQHAMIQERLMGIRMDIERLLQDGVVAGMREPLFDLDEPFGFGGVFGAHPPRRLEQERARVNEANARRDVRELAATWESALFRVPEASQQENAQSIAQQMIDGGQVLVEEVEPLVPPSGSAEDEVRSSSEASQPRPPNP